MNTNEQLEQIQEQLISLTKMVSELAKQVNETPVVKIEKYNIEKALSKEAIRKLIGFNDEGVNIVMQSFDTYEAILNGVEGRLDRAEEKYREKFGYKENHLPSDSWIPSEEFLEMERQTEDFKWNRFVCSMEFDILSEEDFDRLYHFARHYLCFSSTWVHYFVRDMYRGYKPQHFSKLEGLPTKLLFGAFVHNGVLDWENVTGNKIPRDYESVKEFVIAYMFLVRCTMRDQWTLDDPEAVCVAATFFNRPECRQVVLSEWVELRDWNAAESVLLNEMARNKMFSLTSYDVAAWRKQDFQEKQHPLSLIKMIIQ